MAGDWIKMQKSLPRDPKVIRIASALNADRLRTVGGLFAAWCLFDEQTEDGILPGYTPELFDELVGFQGLARGMEVVGWLEIGPDFLAVPRFGEHNGTSAKRRAQDRDRKQVTRKEDKCPPEKRTKSGPEKNRDREELSPPLPPEGDRERESELIAKVKSLRPKWQGRPILTGTNLSAFRECRPHLEGFEESDWDIQREFLAASLPDGSALFQPEMLSKYLEDPEQTLAHAKDWKSKQRAPQHGKALYRNPDATERNQAAEYLREIREPLTPAVA